MGTMNISLPDDMKDFVEAEVRARGFMSASEYIRDLIRDEKEMADFRAKIAAGLESGPARPASEVTNRLREKVRTFKE